MKSMVYEFNLNEQTIKRGIEESGLYTVNKTRQIIISVICALAIANSIYGLTSGRGFDVLSLMSFVAAIILLLYVDIMPYVYVCRQKNYWKALKALRAEILEDRIEIKTAEEETFRITKEEIKGYRKTKNFFIIYLSSDYYFLPTTSLNDEELELTKDLLDGYFIKDEAIKISDTEREDKQ